MNEEELIIRMMAVGVEETVASVDALTASVDGLAERMDAASASAGGGRGKKGLFGHLSSLNGLVAGFAIYKAVQSFASFQSQMEKLKTQTGSTQAEVGRMSKGILNMAYSVGTGPQSLAQALYHIESAGFRGKAALDALRVSAELAQVGGADLTDTTTSLTAVMVAGYAKGKNAVQQLKNAAGELNATVGAGDMTFQDLNDALSTGVLSTFKAVGLKVKDLGAALAVLGDNNVRGAAAANRLRMGLMQLVHPSSTVAGAINSIHMKTFALADDLRKPNGLMVMLRDLKKHLGPLNTNAEKTRAADILGGIFGGGRNSAAMLTLILQMGRLKSKYDDITKSGNSFNQQWQATTKTLQFTLDQLEALGQVLLIKIGKPLSSVVMGLSDFIKALMRGKLWAEIIAGALAAVGAGFMYAKLASIEFSTALEFDPIVAALTLVAVGIVLLITHFKTVKRVVVGVAKDIWHWLVGAFHAVEHAAERVWKIVKKVFDFITGKGGTISKIFSFMNPVGMAGHVLGAGKSILGDITGFLADGGPVNKSGAYVVGERGPEVVYLKQGSYVQPNHELGGGGGQGDMVLEATIINAIDGKPVSRSVIRQGLMATARRGGGAPVLSVAG